MQPPLLPLLDIEAALQPLIPFVQAMIKENEYAIQNFQQAGPFYKPLSDGKQPYDEWLASDEGKKAFAAGSDDECEGDMPIMLPPCEVKFRIRKENVHAKKERSIELDGIAVDEPYRRRGICTAVLRALAHGLQGDEYGKIRVVVLNPISDEMMCVMDKLGVQGHRDNGVAVVWDYMFEDAAAA